MNTMPRTLLVSLALILTACAGHEPETGPGRTFTGDIPATATGGGDWVALTADDGAGLYAEKCGMCHRQNGMGSFILSRRMDPDRVFLEDREDLQSAFVDSAVRQGIGLMFPMTRAEVSDEQLDRIARYLTGEE